MTTYEYDVEVRSLMSTIVNALYSDKDLCFRELISNSSDAIDKLISQYTDIQQKLVELKLPNNLRDIGDLQILVSSKDGYITIEDTGVGMTHADLKNFLGIISNSGTKAFKEKLKESSTDNAKKLIGQFGLGFYSSFLIADVVKVVSKHPLDDCYTFESKGLTNFEITKSSDEEKLLRHGTKVILKVRSGDEKYLGVSVIEDVLKKYSSFISHPIYILKEKEVEEEVNEEVKEREDENKDLTADNKDIIKDSTIDNTSNIDTNDTTSHFEEPQVKEIVEEENNDVTPEITKDTPKAKKLKTELSRINPEKPLWLISPREVTHEQHTAFYKAISNDWEDYLAVKHIVLEGLINLTMLLYLPKKNRNSPFEKQSEKKKNIKVYVSNVFVTADLSDAIPDYLNFVYGVIASDDIPMNVSREITQGKNTTKMIKNNFPKRVCDMLESLVEKENYAEVLKEFGANIKLAVKENTGNLQERFAQLLRFKTTKHEFISLDDYLQNNPQTNAIYVLTGTNLTQIKQSPLLKMHNQHEIILMHEPVDEILLQSFSTYKNIPIKRIDSHEMMKDVLNCDETVISEFKPFTDALKSNLSAFVEDISLKKLDSIPFLVAQSAYGISPAMENMIKSQPGSENNMFYSFMLNAKKNLEIDPNHKVVQCMKFMFENNDDSWKALSLTCYQTALLQRGYQIEDVVTFANNVYDHLSALLSKKTVEKSVVGENNVEVKNIDDEINAGMRETAIGG